MFFTFLFWAIWVVGLAVSVGVTAAAAHLATNEKRRSQITMIYNLLSTASRIQEENPKRDIVVEKKRSAIVMNPPQSGSGCQPCAEYDRISSSPLLKGECHYCDEPVSSKKTD